MYSSLQDLDTPLHGAAAYGHKDAIEEIIKIAGQSARETLKKKNKVSCLLDSLTTMQ